MECKNFKSLMGALGEQDLSTKYEEKRRNAIKVLGNGSFREEGKGFLNSIKKRKASGRRW